MTMATHQIFSKATKRYVLDYRICLENFYKPFAYNFTVQVIYVTRFAKTRHNDAFLEFQIFASMNSINLKLCSVVISMLYYKYFSNYKAR